MEQKPLVSVRLMVYNNEPYIREAVESILMQKTEFRVEIVVGDDFSTDNTLKIIRSYEDTEKINIRILDRPVGGEYWRKRKSKNASVRTNFIDIVENCHGKYVALLDGDDYWTDPLKLQKQVDFMEANPEYAMIFTNGSIVYSEGSNDSHLIYSNNKDEIKRPYRVFPVPPDTTDINTLAKGNYIHTAGTLFVNWLEEGIPAYFEKTTIVDWPLHLMTARKGLIKFMDEDTFSYRVHQYGIYSKKNKIEKLKMALGQFSPVLNSKIFKKDVADIIEDYCLRVAFNYIKVCDTKEDYEYLLDTILAIDSPKLTKNITLQLIEKNVKLANQVKSLKPYKDFNLKRACKLFIKKYFKK